MKEKSGKDKKVVLLTFMLLVSSFLVNFVYAQSNAGNFLRTGSQQLIDMVVGFGEPFLQVLLGGENWTGFLLFEKLVLFILIASIVYLSISKIPPFKGNNGVIWIITIAIPLLGVRYLDFNWINAILIQYRVLGIVLTSILPFVIYFLFLEAMDYGTIRKVGWIFFIVIYYGLWSTTQNDTYSEFYLLTLILSLILLIFDKTIHRWYMWEKIKSSGKSSVEEAATAIRRKMADAQDDKRRGIITVDVFNERMDALEKDLKSIYKHSF
jgi:membrane-bound ClpP family serine protease